MKRILKYKVLVAAIIVFLLLPAAIQGTTLVVLMVGLSGDAVKIKREEASMQKPEVYEPVGRTLALYAQSDPKLFPEIEVQVGEMSSVFLPEQLDDIGGRFYEFSSSGSEVEMGGGFYHFGYFLKLNNQASTSQTKVWDLYFYHDDGYKKLLKTFSLPASAHFTKEALIAKALARYNREISKAPSEMALSSIYKRKIQFFLHFNKIAEARETVQVALKHLPDDWWLNLVQALILHETHSPERAEQYLLAWVNNKPNFYRYLDLAYYYELEQQPHAAAQAAIEATRYRVNNYDSDGHDFNEGYRGYNAAMYAFSSKEYEAAIALSDKLMGSYAREELRNLKKAAQRNLKGEKITVAWSDRISVFDPFKEFDIDRLLQRSLKRPMQKNRED